METIQHGNIDVVYYKLIRCRRDNKVSISCLQDFDEYDYDQSRFIRNSKDEIHVFESEELAQEYLNKWFEPHEIDPEYLDISINSDNIRD